MTGNVTELGPRLVGDAFLVDPDKVLEAALYGEHLEFVLVIGRDKDGGHPYVACSHGQAEALAELELAKHWMLTQALEGRS